MLGVVALVLVVVCKRLQQLPTMLGPAVHPGKDTTHKSLETICNARARPQQCWKSCANGSNIVALRFGDHGTKEMLGIVGSKILPFSNFAQQLPTTCNRVCRPCCRRAMLGHLFVSQYCCYPDRKFSSFFLICSFQSNTTFWNANVKVKILTIPYQFGLLAMNC